MPDYGWRRVEIQEGRGSSLASEVEIDAEDYDEMGRTLSRVQPTPRYEPLGVVTGSYIGVT